MMIMVFFDFMLIAIQAADSIAYFDFISDDIVYIKEMYNIPEEVLDPHVFLAVFMTLAITILMQLIKTVFGVLYAISVIKTH
jgi:hypothetical protein